MQLKSEECIVAFIDILGASNMIQKDVDESLNLVHSVYKSSLEMYNEHFSNMVKLKIAIFSDNIVIACRVKDKEHLEIAFRVIELMSAIIQGNFLFRGVLVRGGIAHGKFFKDEIMIWGDGLTKSYKLEEEIAIFPRIVVDPELIGELGFFIGKCEQKHWLKQDFDGMVYVDYLQRKYIKEYDVFLLKELSRYDDRTIECNNNTRIMQKNIWQINYAKSKLAEETDESNGN